MMLTPALLTAVVLNAQAVSISGTVWIGLTNLSKSEVSVCVSSWSMTAGGAGTMLGQTDVCQEGSRDFQFSLAPDQEYLFQQPLRPAHLPATYALTVHTGGDSVVLRAKLRKKLLKGRKDLALKRISVVWDENKVTVTNKSMRPCAVKIGERDDCADIDREKLLLLPGRVVSISTASRPLELLVFDPVHPCRLVGSLRRP